MALLQNVKFRVAFNCIDQLTWMGIWREKKNKCHSIEIYLYFRK